MASFYDDDLANEIQQDTARIARILSNGIHTYDLPSTKPVDFSHVFPGPFDEPRTLDVLSVATVHREEAAASFTYSNALPDPRNIVNALKRYFPDVWCLTESMRRAGAAGNIRLNMKGQLLFQWSSIVDNCSRSNTWSNSTFVYEIIMVLVHYGLMHSNVAKNQATGGKHVEASKTLKQGAGVLKFVCVELLPKWQSRPAKVPLECEADVLDGCARLMMAQSQQMAIAKVLSSGKSFPPGTLAKLLSGTHELMTGAAGALRRLPKEQFARVDPRILETVGFWLKMYQSLTYKYLSTVSYAEEKYGEATALSRKAEYYTNDIAPLEGCLQELNDDIAVQKASAQTWRQRYQHENESVYFDLPEPAADRLPSTTSKILGSTKSEPFVHEELPIVSFVCQALMESEDGQKGGKKSGKKSGKKGGVEDVTLSGMQGVHDLDNGVALLVAMGYKEEDCRRVLPTVENDVNRAVGVLLGEKEEDGGDGGGGKTSSATSATKTLEVELPEGLEGGAELLVQDPETGQQHTIVVPNKYKPGTKIQIAVK